jgi:hypothetical protein
MRTMTVPDRVTAEWMATLANGQLVNVESSLHSEFLREEVEEKQRRGGRYALLQGPPTLVNAWLKWQLVSNEARSRGLLIRHRR